VVTTRAKADENGHLFGSVNAAAIVELVAKAGHAVEEKDVRLDAPLKTLGAHVVKIHVHGERSADVTVNVLGES
jgi:large subunit ribosomal protein L9